ncbi:MAG TPA: transglutaminase domain-containing protein [Euryarchaeota archaeon]|nr:transglutaminase domain-containing protein [Euryarchaeota archaeon]
MEDRQEIDSRRILTEIEAVDDPVRIFEWVRDIPYGVIDSRDPADVYARHRGTCSGKHLLLAQLLEHMGMEVRHVIAFHRYSELPMETEYPKNLRELLDSGDGVPSQYPTENGIYSNKFHKRSNGSKDPFHSQFSA